MKKCLLFVLLLVLSQIDTLHAQRLTASPDSLFFSPDTVCINQPVSLKSNVLNAASYYWGFCSGYLMDAPTGTNLGATYQFNVPANIDIVKDSMGYYYGFVVNAATTEFLRLNYGKSLSNTPSVTNFGNLTHGLPVNPTTLFIVHDTLSGNWFVFVAGGFTQATSTLGRIDFGSNLNNPAPNVANFGNYGNVLNGPKGIFIAQDANYNWFGYLVNHNTNELIRLDFSFNITNTPLMGNLGNPSGALHSPTDMAGIYDQKQWYLFAVNELTGNSTNLDTGTIVRINLGTSLDTPDAAFAGPIATVITDDNGSASFKARIVVPSSISLSRDCGDIYAYITDSLSSQLIRVQMPVAAGPYTGFNYNNVGVMNHPSCISTVLREGDNLYAFITNAGDNTLTKIDFNACHNATIPSFTEVAPPHYSYDSPGVYNIYFVVNQGLPNMEVSCKAITVLPTPSIFISSNRAICQGDTVRLYAISALADSIRWTSTYAIDTNNVYADSVRVFPQYSTSYNVMLYYPYGCIVDTSVTINVSTVSADAGPDRFITDGSSTILGGPNTSPTGVDSYNWTPFHYLTDSTIANPVANPPSDYTYYLTVTELIDGLGCQARDTVVVHVNCGTLALPNAFAPNSENTVTNSFGILNNEILKLSYFRIYNRWGEEVFETTDPFQRWDGTFNNKPAPGGVYVWEADGFCSGGKRITKNGNVTLLR